MNRFAQRRAMPERRERTLADKKLDAIRFIYGAADKAIAAMTADRLCDSYGVTREADRQEVAEKLAQRQGIPGRLL